MILSVEEYIEKYNDKDREKYLLSFINPLRSKFLIKSGMMQFNEEDAWVWCPPFFGNHVLFLLRDCSNDPLVFSIKENKEFEIKCNKYSIYNWNEHILEKFLGKNYDDVVRHNFKTFGFGLTDKQLSDILNYVQEFDKRSYKNYVAGCDRVKSNPTYYKEMPTIEFPINLYMCGADDTSYSKFFATKEDGLNFIDYLEKNGTFYLKSLNLTLQTFSYLHSQCILEQNLD